MIDGKEYDGRETDIFALGVILFYCVVGAFPFKEATKFDILYQALNGKNPETFWKNFNKEIYSMQFKDLIGKMLNEDPKKRPNLVEI